MDNQCGNVFIRPHGPWESGWKIPGHRHTFDHVTVCFHGAISIKRDDGEVIELKSPRPGYEGPSHALIVAGAEHEITTLEPDTIFWCVYSHRNAQGEVVQQTEGFTKAYGVVDDARDQKMPEYYP